jgi:hypothetical protein
VPVQLEQMINNVYPVLGSRFYFREEHDFGIFQKMLRDNSIISMFDGSTVVNLHALILQLRGITKTRQRRNAKAMDKIKANLELIFSLEKEVPRFNPQKLSIFGRGGDDVLNGLEIALEQLSALEQDSTVKSEVLAKIITLSKMILEQREQHDQIITNSKFEFGHDQSPELFEMTKNYCKLHTAVSCLFTWLYNRNHLGDFFAQGEWLVLSLHRLLRPICHLPYTISEEYSENVAQELLKLYQDNQLFSIIPIQLANNQTQKQDYASSKLQLQA